MGRNNGRLNDEQYKSALEKTASGKGVFPGGLTMFEGLQRGDWQEYNKGVSKTDRDNFSANLKNFANWQLNRMNTATSMGESKQPPTTATTTAAPATEDIQTRRDNFRKSLFRTPSGGDMSVGSVRRKSLLGE